MMALRQVMSGIKHQLRGVPRVFTRPMSNDASNIGKFQDSPASSQNDLFDHDIKNKEPEGLNEIFLMGNVISNLIDISDGRGSSFFIDVPHNRHGGGILIVRTRVVAYGFALSNNVKQTINMGSKVLIRGRLGSKAERNEEGAPIQLSNFVVARSETGTMRK